MLIKEAISIATKELNNQKEARMLMSFFLNLSAIDLILAENSSFKNSIDFFNLVKRAKDGEPIEYITNSVSFYSNSFFIKKGALIPRPETELLIDKVLDLIDQKDTIHIAEIGVGSGIISTMLAILIENSNIIATDISKEAIQIAKVNAKKFNVEDRIKFIHTDYLNNVNQKFDIIVSNPPYIANDIKLEKKLDFEPSIALYGGVNGSEILKDIIDIAKEHKNCYLCCEMGYDQKKTLSSYMRNCGIYDVEFYKDLSGLDRGFVAKIGDVS